MDGKVGWVFVWVFFTFNLILPLHALTSTYGKHQDVCVKVVWPGSIQKMLCAPSCLYAKQDEASYLLRPHYISGVLLPW